MADSDCSEKILIDTLKKLSALIESTPLLLCFRIKEEGGVKSFLKELRLRMVKACIQTGLIDFVDIEISSDEDYIEAVKEIKSKHGTKLILSFHDWNKTPDDQVLLRKLLEAKDKGADIPKLFLMANNYDDTLRVASVARKAREESAIDEPFVFCSMGDMSLMSRVMGGEYGSAFGYFSINDAKGGWEEDMKYYLQLCEAFEINCPAAGLRGND
jgi:3-dehydroquinate dehydratase-1